MTLKKLSKKEKEKLISEFKNAYLIDNLSMKELSVKFNISLRCVRGWLERFKIKRTSPKPFTKLLEKEFGYLKVIARDKGPNGRMSWKCQCKCGNITYSDGKALIDGKTKSCGCYNIELLYKGYNDLSGTYFSRTQISAKKRNLKFDITIKDMWNQYIKQNKKCALTKRDILIVSDFTKNYINHTASIDRIDSSKGYTIDNIQWVHRDINWVKSNFQEVDFYNMCKDVYLNCKEKYESSSGNGP